MSDKVWVVQQRCWHVSDSDRVCYDHEEDTGRPLAVFTAKKKAEAHCRSLEEQARRELSPFQFFLDVEAASDLDEDTLVARFQALGLPAPATIQKKYFLGGTHAALDWEGWWDQCSPELTEEQRSAIWSLFNRLKFYQVISTTLEANEE